MNDNNKGWRNEWFYHAPSLPPRTGFASMENPRWKELLTEKQNIVADKLLNELAILKAKGLTTATVMIDYVQLLAQPIKDKVHLAYEYWGSSDPTQEKRRRVSVDEIVERICGFMKGRITNVGAPKAHSLKRLADLERAVKYFSPTPSPAGSQRVEKVMSMEEVAQGNEECTSRPSCTIGIQTTQLARTTRDLAQHMVPRRWRWLGRLGKQHARLQRHRPQTLHPGAAPEEEDRAKAWRDREGGIQGLQDKEGDRH
ncbi:unnamed protein product [Urochloa humidicola]